MKPTTYPVYPMFPLQWSHITIPDQYEKVTILQVNERLQRDCASVGKLTRCLKLTKSANIPHIDFIINYTHRSLFHICIHCLQKE